MSEGLDLLYWRILEKWDKLKTWLEMWLKRSANIRFTTLAIRAVELWAKHSAFGGGSGNQHCFTQADYPWSISSELDKIVGEAGGGGDVIHMLSDDNSSWMEFQFDEENEIAGHIPDIRLGEQVREAWPLEDIFKSFVWERIPKIVGIIKPRISRMHVDQAIAFLGFVKSYRVEAHRFSGGIWLLCEDSIDIEFLWHQLESLVLEVGMPWILGGDFNAILNDDERMVGFVYHGDGSQLFADFLFSTGLTDLGCSGNPFT
ncbi:hypothetical protein V6N11_071728 [Hibiscus sabdariffa]|uniref:Endonuclease/exonuclease/phosphatase domain-containing protein n=1 Tax=Hibiscus sabdariffa TaxID=183260 RepID=A0ABR2U0X2_9ROSI